MHQVSQKQKCTKIKPKSNILKDLFRSIRRSFKEEIVLIWVREGGRCDRPKWRGHFSTREYQKRSHACPTMHKDMFEEQ